MENIKINNKRPYISIIIPVHNDPEGIVITLKSLITQTYPQELYEIIIVDNNSTDNTLKIIKKFAKKNPNLIVGLSENKIQSSYAARNKAIKHSKGEVLAFIDSDMWVDRKWLMNIARIFKNIESKYVGFNVVIVLKKRTLAALYDKITGFPIEDYIKKYHFAPTCCLIVRKVLFDEIGMFNQNLISKGDNEFGNRVFQKGYNLIYKKDIKMYHPARDSISSLISKWFRIGRGLFQLSRISEKSYNKPKNPLLFFIFFFVPPRIDEFRKKFNKHELSFDVKFFFYCLEWLQRIVKSIGFVYERFIGVNKKK